MTLTVFSSPGGSVQLPSADLVLVDRNDGGNLIVNPPRQVWERGDLTADELQKWACLAAATGSAMLTCLPQLRDGCINYWEAGNWALNEEAAPVGRKIARDHRSVHMHLLGRNPDAKSPSWCWGEAPIFPTYAVRKQWAATHRRLAPKEVAGIVTTIGDILLQKYGFSEPDIEPTQICESCSYFFVTTPAKATALCPECLP